MKTILQKIGMLMAVLLGSLSGSAYDFEMNGIYYSFISLKDLTCEVTKGDVEYSGDIIIPSEVTYNDRQLSVVAIGWSAFSRCESLTSITIPDSVTEIGYSAFEGCSSLTSLYIPYSVTGIGSSAFEGCSSLTSLYIPDSVTGIGSSTFEGCSSLTSLYIPDSVTKIGDSAFEGCSSLMSIKLSDKLNRINYGLFNDCKRLEEFDIPGSVKEIEQYYKDYYDNITETFLNCEELKTLKILSSKNTLFVGCLRDKKVSGNQVESVFEKSDWTDWTNRITCLYIDRLIERSIKVPNLEKLELGESIQKVQIEGMNKLEYLTTIECHALVPPQLPAMTHEQYLNINVLVPAEALELYKNDEVWGNFWNLEANVESVVNNKDKAILGRYDISGSPVDENFKGLVVTRYSDGSTKKVLQK